MTPKALAVAVASPEPARVLAAVRACGEYLRSDDLGEDRRGLAEVLVGLVAHADSDVRQEVAEVCDLLPDPFFGRVLEALVVDPHRFVKSAARRAGERRAQRRKTRTKDDQREHLLGDLLAEIEASPGGKAARRLADRAVRRGAEHFVARLDHELRKPRAAIDRALALLAAEIDKKDASAAEMRRLHAEVERGFGLLASIVQRARAYAEPFTPRFRSERLAEVVDEAKRQLLLREAARAGRIDVTVDVSATLTADVDRNALLQALQNVLQNAVEAYEAETSTPIPIRVSARAILSGSQVEIVIADRGRGMSDEQWSKLFIPFGSTKPGGTGLGLLVTRKMIEDAHAGSLAVASAPDAGTTLTMTLPATQPGAR